MKNVKKDVVEIINSCEVAFLSTINLDCFPETRAMSNVINRNIGDDLNIYLSSHANSPKIEQIKRNSKASLYYFVTENMKNATLFGKIESVNDESLKNELWNEEFAQYYRNGKDDELYGILKFIPTGYKYYVYSATGIPEKIEGKF
ncbi:general stress protein [Alphaproteobacteria bacterium]|nr:general stress protein [Alphaproteobacteria bacterium]